MAERKSRMTVLLVSIVIILALVLVYAFVIKPSLNGYATKLQTEGANAEDLRILNGILAQINQAGYITLPIPGTNQTVTLIPPQLCGQLANTTK